MFYIVKGKNSVSAKAEDENRKDNEKLLAILEVVALVFVTTFIPALIKLGRPPTSLAEVWVELLVAALASLYAYARVRGIDLDPE